RPDSAPSVNGVATCTIVPRKLAMMIAGESCPLPRATAKAIRARIVTRTNPKRRKDILAPPSPGQDQFRSPTANPVDVADNGVGSDEQQNERLNDRDYVNWHLGQELHLGRAIAHGAKKDRGHHDAEGVGLAQQGDGNGVEAV